MSVRNQAKSATEAGSCDEDWLHKTCRELCIPTDDVGSLSLMFLYRPLVLSGLKDEERRRRDDDYRHWRQRPQDMWDRRG